MSTFECISLTSENSLYNDELMSHLTGLTKREADGITVLERILDMKRRKVAESLMDIRRGFVRKLEEEVAYRLPDNNEKVQITPSDLPLPPSIPLCLEKGADSRDFEKVPTAADLKIENVPTAVRSQLKEFTAMEIFIKNRHPTKDEIIEHLFSAGWLSGTSFQLQELYVCILSNFVSSFRSEQHRILSQYSSSDQITPSDVWFMIPSNVVSSKHHEWCHRAYRLITARGAANQNFREIEFIFKRKESSDDLPLPEPPLLND